MVLVLLDGCNALYKNGRRPPSHLLMGGFGCTYDEEKAAAEPTRRAATVNFILTLCLDFGSNM